MQDARGNAHRSERAEATDAEQQLLADPDASVAAIQARSQLAIFGGVSRDIRVEEKQIAASDFHAPDSCPDRAALGFDFHHHRFAVGAYRRFHGQLVDIRSQVLFLLPAILVEPLPEISLPIKQSNTDEGNAEIRGAFDVITGENAQTTRIDRNGFMQSEFG